MPFINDQLEQNKASVTRQAYQRQAVRASRFRFDPQQVVTKLKDNIVGQDHVISAMENLLLTVKADFAVAQRPLAVSFFLGPTGVGKTETVRLLTEALLGSTDKLCRIDMNTLAQEHYTAALTGSPPGYVGSKEGQTLFDVEKIIGSFSEPGIVLFDEVEKANRDVLRAILNILDTGKLILPSGAKTIDFSNTLIFMTSNIGVNDVTNEIAQYQHGWRRWFGLKPKAEKSLLDHAMQNHFDPEFLNRIDRILHFNRLDDHWLEALVTIELGKLNRRLSKKNASLTLSPSALRYLHSEYDRRYGARDVARRIRLELEPILARALIDFPEHNKFTADYQNDELIVTTD